jgi:hypothetical protein
VDLPRGVHAGRDCRFCGLCTFLRREGVHIAFAQCVVQ